LFESLPIEARHPRPDPCCPWRLQSCTYFSRTLISFFYIFT
jgi:hypothetical protein